MKKLLSFLGFVSVLLCSCAPLVDVQDAERITISESKGKNIDGKNVFSHIDSLVLLSKQEWPMGQVKSACKNDSTLYLLDELNSIFAFDLKTGLVKGKIHSVGNAKNEYNTLNTICMKNGKLVALDMASMSVLVYSCNLTFEKRFHLNFPCLDIVPVKGGYLAFNLNASTEKKSVVLLDDNFQEKSSFLDTSFSEQFLLGSKMFTQAGDEAYFISPKQDDIYHWNGDSLKLAYHIDVTDKNAKEKTNKKTISFFKIKDNVVSSFLCEKKVYFNFYNGKKSSAGLVKLEKGIPFVPMFQEHDVLYSVVPVKFQQKSKEENGYRKEAVLIKCW